MMSSKKLAQVLIKISESKNSETKISEFFNYLKKKNLLTLLPQIKNHVSRLKEISSTQNTLVISTKHEISDTEKQEIISLVGADTSANVEVNINDSIIGGFSATYKGNIYDGSLRNQITQLRNRLTH